jgi:myo-inositol 2-dehydrogenase/D-chiro-inositol 1-dehydrogenase
MSAPLRVAVAGLGEIGAIHARNARASERLELVAVASADEARARALASELGRDVAGLTLDDLFAADGIDAAIVSGRSSTHLEYARRVLDRGWHMFLEKPGAITLAEHAELVERAGAVDATVVTGYMRRYDPAFRALKQRVAAGAVGTPALVSLTAREVVVPPVLLRDAGGFIVDLGVHDFDIAAWILGQQPVEAFAITQRAGRARRAFDSALVVVHFDGGGLAEVHLSCASAAGHDIRCEVVGSEGSIALNGLAEGLPSLQALDRGLAEGKPQNFAERFADALRAELDGFAARCAGEPSDSAGLLDDWRALATGVAARASAGCRTPLAIGPDWPWYGTA